MRGYGLELGLRQQLVLTPQLIMNLKLLQMPTMELEQLIRSELEQNPALELSDDGTGSPDGSDIGETASPLEQTPEQSEAKAEQVDGLAVSPRDDYSINELLPDGYGTMPEPFRGGDDDVSGVELAAGPEMGLREAVLPQLRIHLNEADGELAETLIEWLDDDGFLTAATEELAEKLGTDPKRIADILYLMQRIPPGGIGCNEVREALQVQLELAGYPPDSLERILLATHWDLLKNKQTAKIARLCGVSEDDVRAAVGRLLMLEPKPARKFTGSAPTYVAPDFSVEWQGDRLVAVPTDESIPRLRLSRRYQDILRDPTGVPKEEVEFAKQKLNGALMFLRAIESRRRTVRNLVEHVMEQQREFFVNGPEFLKPATLKQAAGKLGVHPSTASRAIANKYVETCFGIFPLKYFFKAGSAGKSRTSIKEKVQAIIEREDKRKPFSDDEIAAKLKEQGLTISRRTVAKYRGELNVPGCNERKGF
jgi:RNA polymerase sigma-54 factor